MSSASNPATHTGHRIRLVMLFGLAALGVMAVIASMLWNARQERLRDAGKTTLNYSAIIEARLDATLRRCDTVLLTLTRTLPHEALQTSAVAAHTARISATLDSNLLNFDEISGIRVFGAGGDLLYTSGERPANGINISDRSYFQSLRDQPNTGLVFSEVIVSRATGRQTITASRALRDVQGRFRGVVTIGLKLEYFQKLFQSLRLAPTA